WAKLKVKDAVSFIGDFEQTLASEAAKRGVDGVVCGHIHHATIKGLHGVLYVNTGDFVESCTAVAEHGDGRFEILTWLTTALERDATAASKPQEQMAERAAA